MMCDKHVVKMILETGQMLSAAHLMIDGNMRKYQGKWIYIHPEDETLYKLTHKNHPCTIWAQTNAQNYKWLYEHFRALCTEYTYRYGRTHKTEERLDNIVKFPPMGLVGAPMTDPPLAMPDEYKVDNDPVGSYRRYYKYGKTNLLKYTKRKPPEWLNEIQTVPS